MRQRFLLSIVCVAIVTLHSHVFAMVCPDISASGGDVINMGFPVGQSFIVQCDAIIEDFTIGGPSANSSTPSTINLYNGLGNLVFSQMAVLDGDVTFFMSVTANDGEEFLIEVIPGNTGDRINIGFDSYADGDFLINGNPNSFFDMEFSVTLAETLPVELSTFRGDVVQEGVQLSWSTASEVNNEGFEIERSSDGIDWAYIGYVEGIGTTTEAQYYTYLDADPQEGINYYRLKQVDYDGNYEYSKVVPIDLSLKYLNGFNFVNISPNPVLEGSRIAILTIDVDENNLPLDIQVFNVEGALLSEQRTAIIYGENNIVLNLDNLAAGTYFIRATAYGVHQSKKLVIK